MSLGDRCRAYSKINVYTFCIIVPSKLYTWSVVAPWLGHRPCKSQGREFDSHWVSTLATLGKLLTWVHLAIK